MARTRISTVVTHARPHLDEISSLYALTKYDETYSGLGTASVEVYDPEVYNDGRSEEEWESEGVLFIGVRGGKFDEHGLPDGERDRECALTLVLKQIGLDKDTAWGWLAKQVLREDRRGSTDQLHLATCIKALSRSMVAKDVIRLVNPVLEALLIQQRSFDQALRIAGNADKFDIENVDSGKQLLLVVVDECDNEDVSRAARWKEGLNAAMVIQRNTKGHVYISTNGRCGIKHIEWLAAQLRYEEQRQDRGLGKGGSYEDMKRDGLHQRWYHQREARALYSGSLTATKAQITKLSLEDVRAKAIAFLSGCKLWSVDNNKGRNHRSGGRR